MKARRKQVSLIDVALAAAEMQRVYSIICFFVHDVRNRGRRRLAVSGVIAEPHRAR